MTSELSRPFIARWRSAVLTSTLPSSAKLCLLSLGEFANPDGTSCFPSLASVAQLASMNERSVRRCWDNDAEPGGWFTRRHKGSQQGWARFEYTLLIPDGADTESTRPIERADIVSTPHEDGPDNVSTRQQSMSGHCVQDVRTLSTEGVDTVSTDLAITQNNTKKTANTSPKRLPRTKGKTFTEWLAGIEPGEQAIPETHSVIAYAERIGLPDDMLTLAWEVFRDRYIVNQTKRYLDWPQVFRNAIEGNWLKLWYYDQSGSYILSTAGLQAQRAYAEAA